MSHIAVERNRRRQMNEHLKVLRSLTPSLYISRGDQASIIGGAIDFIKELQQAVESMEAQKRGLSPSLQYQSSAHLQCCSFKVKDIDEVVACCNSPIADVEAKISGSNVVLRTVSKRIPAQLTRIITALDRFSFQILHLNVSSMEDDVLYSFALKIGVECQASLEELATKVQQSFSPNSVYAKEITSI